MRLRRTAATAAAMLALAACSDGGGQRADTVQPRDTAPPVTTSATPAGPKQATVAQVKAALLDVDELPTGWSVDKDEDDDEDDDFSEGCPELAAMDKAFEGEDNPDAEIAFSKDDFGPFLGEAAASLATPERASEGIAALKKAFNACPAFSYRDDEGKKVSVEIAPVSFAKLGDQTLAARLSMTFEGGTARMTMVVVRVRNHVALITGMGITTILGGGRLEASELEEIARAAVTKLERSLP